MKDGLNEAVESLVEVHGIGRVVEALAWGALARSAEALPESDRAQRWLAAARALEGLVSMPAIRDVSG